MAILLGDADSSKIDVKLLGFSFQYDTILGHSLATHDHTLGYLFLQVFTCIYKLLTDWLFASDKLFCTTLFALRDMKVYEFYQRKEKVLRRHFNIDRINVQKVLLKALMLLCPIFYVEPSDYYLLLYPWCEVVYNMAILFVSRCLGFMHLILHQDPL